jgi:hypothetical protein
MWDEETMPSVEERTIDLCRYSNHTHGTADAEMCAAIARETPEYSYRGYCTWGIKREREKLDAAVAEARKRRELVLYTVVCAMLARERRDHSRKGTIARELETLPSHVLMAVCLATL